MIKEAGGMVMVQDEASAKFSGMPDSAASTGLADFVLPPQEMALRLVRFVLNPILVPADPQASPGWCKQRLKRF